MALIDNQPRMATARATEATTVAVITAEQFRRMLEKSDPISRKLIGVLTNRIRYQSSEIARLKSILGVGK
jgi:CRP-like cAMP-binding protein